MISVSESGNMGLSMTVMYRQLSGSVRLRHWQRVALALTAIVQLAAVVPNIAPDAAPDVYLDAGQDPLVVLAAAEVEQRRHAWQQECSQS